VRANAARVLSQLAPLPAEAVAPLVACADADDGVRLNRALALRSAPPKQAAAAFHLWLPDPSSRVRLLAAGSLLKAFLEGLRRRAGAEVDPELSGLPTALVERLGRPKSEPALPTPS
jgi:hypothetical protein